MTIKRKVLLLFFVLISLAMALIFNMTMKNARHYAQIQLQRFADDAANSLGVALTPAYIKGDRAMVETLLDAVFDRGNVVEISLFNAANELVTTRRTKPRAHHAPAWFQAWLPLELIPGVYEIKYQRKVMARVQVLGDRGYMYHQLWVAANKTFLAVTLVGFGTFALFALMARGIFRPLTELEEQAESICNRDLTVQQPLPKSRELRRIVQAMNRMQRQLKSLFDEQVAQIEQVRNQAYIDSVSGLGNGRFFNAQVDARIHAPEEPFAGALVRIQIDGLLAFNEQYGKHAGDGMLRQIGRIWQQAMEGIEGSCVARVSGARFAALLPYVHLETAQQKILETVREIRSLDAFSANGGRLRLFAGMSYCEVGENAHLLESQADQALQKALADDSEELVIFKLGSSPDPVSAAFAKVQDWEYVLKRTLEQRDIVFHYQPVVSCVDQSVMHHEVLARVRVDDGLVNAGLFIPLVERFRLEDQFDRLIVELVLEKLMSLEPSHRSLLAVNLSPHSIRNEDFVEWLLDKVNQHREFASLLLFEVPEITVRLSHGKLKRLAAGLKEAGAKLAIDHFGTTNSSFGYLSGLPLHSIKVDQSYIRDIVDNLDHQFFVQSLVRIAHSRQILLTAEMVESQAQWDLLRSFQLDGAQGYYLGEPKTLDSAA